MQMPPQDLSRPPAYKRAHIYAAADFALSLSLCLLGAIVSARIVESDSAVEGDADESKLGRNNRSARLCVKNFPDPNC